MSVRTTIVTIAIPCYNEAGNISKLSTELFPVLEHLSYQFEILIIDDGSSDTSSQEIEELIRQDSRVRLIVHKKNLGLGVAVRSAITHSFGDLLIFLDADLSFPPEEIPKLLTCYEKNRPDCVIGSHLLNGGSFLNILLHYRLLITKVANALYALVLGTRFTAYTPLFRLYDAPSLRALPITSESYTVSAEIIFLLIKSKLSIEEVPVTLRARSIGISKMKFCHEIYRAGQLLWRIFCWRISGKT